MEEEVKDALNALKNRKHLSFKVRIYDDLAESYIEHPQLHVFDADKGNNYKFSD